MFHIFLLLLLGASGFAQMLPPPPSNDESIGVVEGFLKRMKAAVTDKDQAKIGALFLEDFQFFACTTLLNKSAVVDILMKFPPTGQLEIELLHSKWIDYNVDIDYTVAIRGFQGKELTARFHLVRDFIGSFYRLAAGEIQNCTRMTKEFALPSVNEISESLIIKSFPKEVEEKIGTSAIGELFSDGYFYEGCKRNYTKDEAVSVLSKLPREPKFSFNVTSSKSKASRRQIEFTVIISGPHIDKPIISEFLYSTDNHQLVSGKTVQCERPAGLQSQDPEVVIKKFLKKVREIDDMEDDKKMEALVDNWFIFEGCSGYYNKKDAIKFKNGVKSPMDFKLKSAKWNHSGQVEFVVHVSRIQDNPDVDVQFSYCPYRKMVMSGKILGCFEPY